MFYLVYISASSSTIEHTETIKILEKSRTNNANLKVTGMLFFVNDFYLQILEGEKEIVASLYKKISVDRRHTNVEILLEGEQPERLFSEWSMGFKVIGEDDSLLLDRYFDMGSKKFKNLKDNFPLEDHAILNFLKSFSK